MPVAERQPARRPPARRRPPEPTPHNDPPKAWVTVGTNIQVAPYNSVSYSFGFTNTVADETPRALLRKEREMYDVAERLVDRRIRKLVRLAQQIREQHGLTDE